MSSPFIKKIISCIVLNTLREETRIDNIVKRVWSNKGFTMVEALLSLTATIMLAGLVTTGLSVIFDLHDGEVDAVYKMEWDMFVRQINREIKMVEEVTYINPQKLQLLQQGDVITYERYGNLIRRRVNGTGHELLLQEVDSFSFSKEGKGTRVLVRGLNGMTYETIIYKTAQLP